MKRYGSLFTVYERVGKSVILVRKRPKRTAFFSVKMSTKRSSLRFIHS